MPRNEIAVPVAIAQIFREALTCRTEQELGRACLQVAEALTGSRFGFIAEISQATGRLEEIAVSGPEGAASPALHPADPASRAPFSLEIHGIYGRVLRDGAGLFTNDPAAHPDSIGTPPGHPPLRAFLGVPLIHAGQTIGMIGLGNREGGYGPEQLEALNGLAPAIVQTFLNKRAERELSQERAKLDTIMQATDVMLVLLDPAFNFVWVNPAYAQTCGMRPEEMVGKNHFALYPDAENEAIFRRVRDTGEAVFFKDRAFEFPDQPERGVTYWDWSLAPVHADQGGVSGLVFSLRETTRYVRAEQALRASEERLRLAAEATGFGSYDYDVRARRLVWSAELYAIVGLPDSTVISRELLLGLVHPDDRPAMQRHVAQVLDATGEGRHELEFRIRRPDGDTRWVRATGRTYVGTDGEPGRVGRVVGTVQDITERKRADAAMQASEERFRGLVEQAVDGIFVADARGYYTDVNTAGAQMLGYTPDEIRRLNIADVIAPEELARIPDEVLQFPEVNVVRSEWRFRRKDGSSFVGEVVGRRLADGRLQAILRDVTERRRVEAALREADRRKDEFLATLAHELRNPLVPIRNAVEILRLEGFPGPTAQAARDMIERQVTHMVRLIDDLLDVSRITSGRLHLRRERVQLGALLEQALESARSLAECAGIELAVELPPEPIHLDADPVRLVQVISNLLNNACKYTDVGGQVRLRAECVGREVAVQVEDTGIGIPSEHLPLVFDMFSQVPADAELPQAGLGIGLSLARNLVELHGGRIEARSAGAGQGSTFTVWLPLAVAGPAAAVVEPSTAAERALAPGRILIADDQDDVVESLALLLRMHGNEVRTARDGLEAVAEAERFRPDLVLLDIGMPGLDGYGACKRLREQPWGRALTIVALTGWGRDADRRRSEEAGFDAHLVKPVDPAEVLALMKEGRADEVKEPG